MCPLSGLVQLFVLLVSLLLVFQGLLIKAQEFRYKISLDPMNPTIHMNENQVIAFNLTGPDEPDKLLLEVENPHIATTAKEVFIRNDKTGFFNVTGQFLGKTRISFKVKDKDSRVSEIKKLMDIIVIRKVRIVDTLFTVSVAALVAIIYINFGCALNWRNLKPMLKRPVGPVVGFFTQFLVMPLLSFFLGKILFPESPEMQLGMFFTGVAPGGGASNIWVVILDGNLDLSVTMTAISTFAAFGMIPLWIFTLGRVIFNEAKLVVPYSQISSYAVALVIPLFIGYLIQRYLKNVARFMVRILKMFSGLLILFIVVFAILTNLYLFELFSWKIVVAGMGLPWLGYVLAWCAAKLFNQDPKDCLTIAIETGIQNTGIAIFLLRFALDQPQADLTTVAPVSVAMMTPLPLLGLFILKKINEKLTFRSSKGDLLKTGPEMDIDNNVQSLQDQNSNIAIIS